MMKSSKFSGQPKRPPWKPWGGPIHLGNKTLSYENNGVHNSDFEVQPAKSSSFRHQRRVTFENFSHVPRPILLKQQEEKHYEDNIKSRNLGVSHQLLHQFKPKGPRKVILPEKKLISETHSSFRIPGKEKSIPIRHSGYKTIIDMTASTSSSNNANKLLYERDPAQRGEVMHSLDADAVAKIHDMKSQILAGNYVSMTDITALKMKLGRYQEGVFEKPDPLLSSGIPQNIRKRRRIVARKPIFCEKGIVHVPTPHTTQPEINTFGTPADLRISLSNSDTNPEFNGRRRFYFDFTGFLDDDIKLYLEGSRRLVIRGERPERSEKPALKVTDFIDLPRDLPVDNLRIVRDLFGTLIIEEAWKFL